MQTLDRRTTLLYSAGSIGAGAFFAFNNFVLPPILKSFGAPDLLTGLLSSTRSIEGVVIQPTVGAISDRIWTPHLGRRRIFIAIGIPLSAFFFVIAGFFTHTLLGLAIAIFLFSIFFNAAVDPYAALLADIAPVQERGLLSGVSTGIQLFAQVVFLVIVSRAAASGEVPLWIYPLVGVTMVVSFAATILGIKERRELVARKEHYGWRRYLGAIARQTAAMRYLATLFVYQFGINAVLPYLTLFIIEDIGETAEVAFALAGLTLLVTAASAVVSGKIAERVGSRTVLALAGVGNGAATAMSWPLLTELIPPDETGVFAGLKAASESFAIPLSVFVAAEVFLPRFGYRGIFAMLAINIVIALVLLFVLVRSRGTHPAARLAPA
ncbi:MAG: SLC45 family MFS transporter [Chloroflexi bacterium]|nr:MAG: SLC45 family MFS transporter [Chloroflexota bacterium]